jgi:hypothetical protein
MDWLVYKARPMPQPKHTPIFIFALFPKNVRFHASLDHVRRSQVASGATSPLQKKAALSCPSPNIPFCCTKSEVDAGGDFGGYEVKCTY